jgi:hypothetical protein
MDIVGFARPGMTPAIQNRKINFLKKTVLGSKVIKARRNSLIKIWTGDGMALGFQDSVEHPFKLAIEIDKHLRKYNTKKSDKNRIDIRIGLHSGPVEIVRDINNKENAAGPGIIIAQRVMSFGDAGHILASDAVAMNLININPKYADMLHPIGTFHDKHGQPIALYNAYSEQTGNSKTPKKIIDEIFGPIEHLRAEREIEILDPRKMLVRHTHTYVFKNTSEGEVNALMSSVILDSPHSLKQMKLRVVDRHEKELGRKIILDIPRRKDYYVKPSPPIRPGQIYTYTESYCAREPERYFEYFIPKETGLFEFALICPQSAGDLSLRVYDVDPVGEQKPTTIEPEIAKYDDKTEIRWIIDRPKKGKYLRFEW